MKEVEKKDFAMYEGDVEVLGQRLLNQLIEHIVDFTPRFPTLGSTFQLGMQAQIDLCRSIDTDDVCVGRQSEQTAIVEEFMKTGRVKYQDGELYLNMVWKKDVVKLRNYGQPKYEEARSSHVKLPILLMQAYGMVSDVINKPLLIAKGYSSLEIEKLKSTSDDIIKAAEKQEKLMEDRFSTTQTRTKNFNILWAMMSLISECAKKIYVDNPVMWNLFLLYSGTPTPPPTPEPPAPTV